MNIQIQKRYQKAVDEFVKEDFIEKAYGRALSHAKDRREAAESIVEDAEKFLDRIKRAIEEMK